MEEDEKKMQGCQYIFTFHVAFMMINLFVHTDLFHELTNDFKKDVILIFESNTAFTQIGFSLAVIGKRFYKPEKQLFVCVKSYEIECDKSLSTSKAYKW